MSKETIFAAINVYRKLKGLTNEYKIEVALNSPKQPVRIKRDDKIVMTINAQDLCMKVYQETKILERG